MKIDIKFCGEKADKRRYNSRNEFSRKLKCNYGYNNFNIITLFRTFNLLCGFCLDTVLIS